MYIFFSQICAVRAAYSVLRGHVYLLTSSAMARFTVLMKAMSP